VAHRNRLPGRLPATPILLVPPLGVAILVVFAARSDGSYSLLVGEDALLEWTGNRVLIVVATAFTVAPGGMSPRPLAVAFASSTPSSAEVEVLCTGVSHLGDVRPRGIAPGRHELG
jgi:hypothetical protein